MKKIFIIIFVIFSAIFIFKISEKNYEKQLEIKQNLIEKPNFLPNKNYALNTSFWFKNIKANYYWLQLIQYIWGNAINSSYKNYLFSMWDLITELNPFFEEPYITSMLLLPSYNQRYENLSKEIQEKYKNQAIEIWQKWIKNFCDLEKIKLIEKETNLEKLFKEEKYQNPCKNGEIAYNLAFIYYFYKKDFKNAVKYYKIASVSSGSPEAAKNLISIFEWKLWNREKSFFMFLNMANYSAKDNEICREFSGILQDIWKKTFEKKIFLNWEFFKNLEKIRKENLKKEENWLSETSCENFLNKAIRELNLYYLEEANKNFKQKFWKNSSFPKDLKNAWFIDYIPKDYQQEKNYWIIYFFDPEIWVYDYKMGRYE